MASRQTFKRGTVLARGGSSLILTETDKLLYGDARKELDAGDDELREPGNDKLSLSDLSRRDCNLIFAMPLFWMIAIYQPFIYFVIQLKEVHELGMNATGLFTYYYSTYPPASSSRMSLFSLSLWAKRLIRLF